MTVSAAPAAGWLRTAGFASAALLCIALPALVAGIDIDAPPADGELERLRAAWNGTIGSDLARQFELAQVPLNAERWPADRPAELRLLGTARLMQVLAIFAISALAYLVTTLARGRLAALATCLAFAALPAVYEVGHVLRPETASVTFAMLGLLLLQCMAHAVHGGRSRGPWRRSVVLVLLAANSGLAIGLAIGTMPTMGGMLLVPIALFMLATLQLLLRGMRIGTRRSFMAWPAHAITRRLWPVALAALLSPTAAMLCMLGSLTVPADEVSASELSTSVLPAGTYGAAVLIVLAIVGALSFLVRTGIRFGRRGRLGPDVVLLVYAGTQIIYATGTDGRFDPLPAGPAVAVLVAEGAYGIVALVAWLSRRR